MSPIERQEDSERKGGNSQSGRSLVSGRVCGSLGSKDGWSRLLEPSGRTTYVELKQVQIQVSGKKTRLVGSLLCFVIRCEVVRAAIRGCPESKMVSGMA